jgi:hypothetical protein
LLSVSLTDVSSSSQLAHDAAATDVLRVTLAWHGGHSSQESRDGHWLPSRLAGRQHHLMCHPYQHQQQQQQQQQIWASRSLRRGCLVVAAVRLHFGM